uniref:Uncharacterized protein n=1 Tax=Siphoviridae sp. ctHSY3 TaxID=2825421 RepID=A0A8S5TV15_9CAUD|nr:MAG TPA: hypothetical protein [Siphoviridae sp. ctHSY3]
MSPAGTRELHSRGHHRPRRPDRPLDRRRIRGHARASPPDSCARQSQPRVKHFGRDRENRRAASRAW